MDENDPTEANPSSTPRRPTGWLLFYCITALAGSAYLAYLAIAPNVQYRIQSATASVCAAVVGLLFWFRSKWGLPAYCLCGLGVIGIGVYRLWSDGYSSNRIGIMIGGIVMLLGYWGIAEEFKK